MPACERVKRGEHADGVERDQVGDVGLETITSRMAPATARAMMPLENTSRWPALGELLGHEGVVGVEAGQAGEVGEAGVGRQHQDEHGGGLGEEEQRRGRPAPLP